MKNDSIENLKVAQLRTELKKAGLPVGGKKKELIARLRNFLQENINEASDHGDGIACACTDF